MLLESAQQVERTAVLLGKRTLESEHSSQDLSHGALRLNSERDERWPSFLSETLIQRHRYAGRTARDARRSVSCLVLACTGLFLIALILGTPTLAILICLPPLWSYYSLQRAARLRALHFEQDYTALLLTLASSIKTGLDPLQALTQAHEYFHAESSVRCELLKLKNNLEAGMAEEHVINDFASTIDHPDINLFRIAFVLSRKEGSSLAECLRRLVRVTRQRQSFRRKIKAAVATQKLSANGIAVCAVFIAAVQISSNYKAMVQAYNHPVGFKILFGGVVVILLGVYLLRRMANTQFES